LETCLAGISAARHTAPAEGVPSLASALSSELVGIDDDNNVWFWEHARLQHCRIYSLALERIAPDRNLSPPTIHRQRFSIYLNRYHAQVLLGSSPHPLWRMFDQDFLKQRDRFSQDLTGFIGVPLIKIGQRSIYRPAVKPNREFRPS
jgi:hypothetical protein